VSGFDDQTSRPLEERLQRITGKLAVIADLPQPPAMFGAHSHRFQLGPPLTEGTVADFERHHQITDDAEELLAFFDFPPSTGCTSRPATPSSRPSRQSAHAAA